MLEARADRVGEDFQIEPWVTGAQRLCQRSCDPRRCVYTLALSRKTSLCQSVSNNTAGVCLCGGRDWT